MGDGEGGGQSVADVDVMLMGPGGAADEDGGLFLVESLQYARAPRL